MAVPELMPSVATIELLRLSSRPVVSQISKKAVKTAKNQRENCTLAKLSRMREPRRWGEGGSNSRRVFRAR